MLHQLWSDVATLRAHGVAHRDLRLANVFLADDGRPMLIDFGFGELSASRQLLDTDVAELLAATTTKVGIDRAMTAAVSILGADAVADGAQWLMPATLTSATRHALSADGSLTELRERLGELSHVSPSQPVPRPRPATRLGLFGIVAIGLYLAVATALEDDVGGRVSELRWPLVAAGVVASLLFHPADAMAFRAASGRRASLWPAVQASLASQPPSTPPTSYWARAAHLHFEAGRSGGLTSTAAAKATSTWVRAGLSAPPLLVAIFAASGLRVRLGYVEGLFVGVLLG